MTGGDLLTDKDRGLFFDFSNALIAARHLPHREGSHEDVRRGGGEGNTTNERTKGSFPQPFLPYMKGRSKKPQLGLVSPDVASSFPFQNHPAKSQVLMTFHISK